jgi:hypothetical protein
VNPRTATIIALSLAVIAAFIVLFNYLKDDPSPDLNAGTEAGQTRNSDRKREGNSTESKEERMARVTREELVREVKQKQLAFWSQNASAGLAQSKKILVADLDLSASEAAEVEEVFARREAELAGLLARMHSGEAADDVEHLGKICALLRNKGLREDLVGVLSAPKLATFDANEANRERETIEARAYRDMADLNAVVLLTDSQKQQVLAALMKNAPVKVEHEADARAFMTLNYGQMLTDVDSSSIRGLANMVSAKLNYEMPDVEIESPQYQQWTQSNKTERIENELSVLQNILNENQLARYREHLEAEPPW